MNYLVYRKPVIVIDVKKHDIELFKTYENQFQFLLNGVSNYDYDELMKVVY